MTKVPEPLSAAVLAGGKSSRMGQDKAFLTLTDGGQPMIETVLERLQAIADDVLIVANDPARFASLGVRVVPDLEPGMGALAGIQAALSGAAYDHCLVVACDMPFLNPALLHAMATLPRDYDVLAPYLPGASRQSRDGRTYQTLHAIYGKACLPAIAAQVATGNRQVIGFFPGVRVRPLEIEEVQEHDPDLRSFFNANTPEALEIARSMAMDLEPKHAN